MIETTIKLFFSSFSFWYMAWISLMVNIKLADEQNSLANQGFV